MDEREKISQIALSLTDGIGSAKAEILIEQFETATEVLKQNARVISEVCCLSREAAENITIQFPDAIKEAEKEYDYTLKKGLKTIFFTDDAYPVRMRQCAGFPILLYVKGECDFNEKRYVSVVGTRRATEHGKRLCTKFVEDLAAFSKDIVIISGLAYGIDVTAHRAALASGLKTYGIVAGGFNHFYPADHISTANKMIETGGAVVTEFTRDMSPLPVNFARRNRIIAGMSDATIVVESAVNGGSLITAKLASSYGRELYAFPGRVGERLSAGCNNIIKYNKAGLIESAEDFLYFMEWKVSGDGHGLNIALEYLNLTEEERDVYEIIEREKRVHIDTLQLYLSGRQNVTTTLLNMELKGVIERMPGNFYALC